MPFRILIGIAALLSFTAGMIAFLIAYDEYSRHFSDRRKALRTALEAALAAILFFGIVGAVAGIMLARMLS